MVGGAEQNACRPAVRAHGDAACTAGLAETAPTGTHSGGPGRGTLWPGAAGFGMGPAPFPSRAALRHPRRRGRKLLFRANPITDYENDLAL